MNGKKAAWLMASTVLMVVALMLSHTSTAGTTKQKRSAAAKREFAHHQPCPSTGRHEAHCPGYVIDHIQPLCAGGPDVWENMQWQTLKESRRKDVRERRYCWCLKHPDPRIECRYKP